MASPFAAPSTAGGSSDGASALFSLSSSSTDGIRGTACVATAIGSGRGGNEQPVSSDVGGSASGSGHGGEARTDQPAPLPTAVSVSRLVLPPSHQTQWQKTNVSPVHYSIASAPPPLAGNSPRSEGSRSTPQRPGFVSAADALASRGRSFVSKRKALAILDSPPLVRSDMSPRGGMRRELTNAPSTTSGARVGQM